MAGFNFGAIGTAVGGFLTGYDQARERQLKQQKEQAALVEQQEQRKRLGQQEDALRKLYGVAQSGGLDAIQPSLPGATPAPRDGAAQAPQIDGSFGGAPAQQQLTASNGTQQQQYQQPPADSGLRSGLPNSTDLRSLLQRGAGMALPEGYRADVASADRPGARVAGTGGMSQHAKPGGAIDARIVAPDGQPVPGFMGEDKTGMYGRLARGMYAAGGPEVQGKLASGTQFGKADAGHFDLGGDRGRRGTLAAAVAAMPTEFHQEAQQGANTLVQNVPPNLRGLTSRKALADILDKADPGGDPLVKMMAIEHAQKLLAPSEQRAWEMFKIQQTDQFHMALQDRQDARQDKTIAAGEARQERSIIGAEQRQEQRDRAAEQRQDKKDTAAKDAKLSSDSVSNMADQYLAGDRSVMQNLGRGAQGAQNIVALRAEIAKKMAERGMSGADMATKMAEFEGLKAGERTLTQRTANIGMRINEAKTFAPLALAASEKVDRTQFPTLNSLLLAAERGTGGEDVVRLSVATMSLLNAYAAAVTPTGTPTEGAQSRAHELLDKAWSQGQYRVAIDQLMMEMEAASKSPGMVREEFRRGADPARSTAAPAATPPQQGGGAQRGTQESEDTDPEGNVWIFRNGEWQRKDQGPPI